MSGGDHNQGECTCEWTDPSTWFTHYGAVEPGSTREFDPECPEHACPECSHVRTVIEEFDDQIGFEEQARPVHVAVLACGHEVVTPSRWDVSS